MGKAPDQIEAEIEQTRAELADDVDRLADKTSPRRIARRRGQRIATAVRNAKDRFMGTSSESTENVQGRARAAGQAVQEKAGGAAEAVKSTPDRVMRQTEGNPMAAGLIAFGGGLLIGSLLPTSQAERQSAQRVSEQVGEIAEPVKEALAESTERIKDEAMGATKAATEEVKETAAQAARTTGEEGRDKAKHVTEQARESGQTNAGGPGRDDATNWRG
jgi:hypothetical protein